MPFLSAEAKVQLRELYRTLLIAFWCWLCKMTIGLSINRRLNAASSLSGADQKYKFLSSAAAAINSFPAKHFESMPIHRLAKRWAVRLTVPIPSLRLLWSSFDRSWMIRPEIRASEHKMRLPLGLYWADREPLPHGDSWNIGLWSKFNFHKWCEPPLKQWTLPDGMADIDNFNTVQPSSDQMIADHRRKHDWIQWVAFIDRLNNLICNTDNFDTKQKQPIK